MDRHGCHRYQGKGAFIYVATAIEKVAKNCVSLRKKVLHKKSAPYPNKWADSQNQSKMQHSPA